MEMTGSTQAAIAYFEQTFENAPHLYPNDKELFGYAIQKDWRRVLMRLRLIRDSLSEQERQQISRQGLAHQYQACKAENVLCDIKKACVAVESTQVEQRLLNELPVI